jgi:polyferredoxin
MNEPTHGAAAGRFGLAGRGRRQPGIDPLLRWRFYPGLFHWLLIAVLVALIYFAFAPGQRGEGNLATEVVWRLWWPGLAFLLLVGGRIWCGVCPFGGVADMAGKTRKGRPAPPKAFRKIAPWLGVISVFTFGLAFLALGLEGNAGATGIILIGLTALAFMLSLAFRGRTFCRYLCPVGMITRVYSFFSWLRPHGSPRTEGPMAVCPVGQSPASLRQPSQCQMCGVCTSEPEARGISTTIRPAAPSLPGGQEFGRAEAVLSLLLLGLMASDSVRMTQIFARFQHLALTYFDYNYRLTVTMGVTGMVGIILLVQLLASQLGARRLTAAAGSGKRSGSSTFNAIGFSYLPLTMGVFLSLALQHLWSGAWPSLQTVLLESRLIDWSGHMPPTNVYFVNLPLKMIQLTLLGVGLYFSLKLARKDLPALLTGEVGGAASDSREAANGSQGPAAGALGRSAMVLTAFAGFGFLFLLPMSGAC